MDTGQVQYSGQQIPEMFRDHNGVDGDAAADIASLTQTEQS
jgi:hypothetical protein